MSDTNQLLTQILQKIDPDVSDVDQHSAQILQKLKTSYSVSESDIDQLLNLIVQILEKLFPNEKGDLDQLVPMLHDIYNTSFLSHDGGINDWGRHFQPTKDKNKNWFNNHVKDDSKAWTIDYTPSGPYGAPGSPSKLYARYLAAKPQASNSHKTVIISHGMNNNSLNVGDFARVFWDLGYNILAPDARGYGLSSDPNRNLGIFDSDDVLKWVDKLVEYDPNVEVVLFGGSMGASTTLQSSYKNKSSAVKAIIEDCGHSQLNKYMKYYMQNHVSQTANLNDLEIFAILLAFDLLLFAKQGVILADGLTEAGLATTTLPILTIHGTIDGTIPAQNASIISSLVNTNIKYEHRFFAEGADHYASVNHNPTEYVEQVTSFLNDVANPPTPDPDIHIMSVAGKPDRSKKGTLHFTAGIQQEVSGGNKEAYVGNFDIIISSNATMSATIANPKMEFTTTGGANVGTCDVTITFPNDPIILALLQNSQVTIRRMYHGQQNEVTVGLVK